MNRSANSRTASVLSIAGSDSGGGAGIQADLKTFAAFGLHGLSAVTAVTAQNSRKVVSCDVLPAKRLAEQLRAVFEDFDVLAVKIGMLGTAANVQAVIEQLQRYRARNVVLDPVVASSSGAPLLNAAGMHRLKSGLLPLVDVLTPNIPEAQALLDRPLKSRQSRREAAVDLLKLGPGAVLLKGGHARGHILIDVLAQSEGICAYNHKRLPFPAHGTGCVLSAALAAGLAQGQPLSAAVEQAERFLQLALRTSYRSGKSSTRTLGPLAVHSWQSRKRYDSALG